MKITFVFRDGAERTVEFKAGQTILNVAEENDIVLSSFCEGFGVCGACHVYVENLIDKLPEISDVEDNALDNSRAVKVNSRLACRIVLDKSLDGLKVKLP